MKEEYLILRWIVGICGAVLLLLSLGLYGLSVYESVKMAELGYQKSVMIGSNYNEYQKAR